MKLNLKNQNVDSLVKNDDELKVVCLKRFMDLTEEEFDKLPQCKCKVTKETNNYGNTRYIASLELCKGVVVRKTLRDDEVSSIKLNNPTMITNASADVEVPVKFTCFASKNDPNKLLFKYSAIISPNVYMGMSKNSRSGDTGYLNDRTLNNIVASSIAFKTAINFIKLEASDFEELETIETKIAEMDFEEF